MGIEFVHITKDTTISALKQQLLVYNAVNVLVLALVQHDRENASSNVRLDQLSIKNPRWSPNTLGSTMTTPSIFVLIISIPLPS